MFNLPDTTKRTETNAKMAQLVDQVMAVSDTTVGRNEDFEVRYRGQLTRDSEEAFDYLEAEFKALKHTPWFRIEDGVHVIYAISGVVNVKEGKPIRNLILFILTAITVLQTGAMHQLGHEGIVVETFGEMLQISLTQIYKGWPFAVSLLAILLAHEFGHYFAARYHKSPASLPFFIPFPFSPFGTFGAIISMKAPIKNRKILTDIGVAGPFAGFIVALPVLYIGISLSELSVVPQEAVLEGNSIVYLLMKYLVHGELLPRPVTYGEMNPLVWWARFFFTGQPLPIGGPDILMHPVAWAGWAGILVTGLNLLPVGQLDGGHAASVLFGKKALFFVPVVIALLVPLAFFWIGWWLWIGLILLMGRQKAPLLDEITPVNPMRKALAIGALVLFVLVFTPIPLQGL